MAVAKLGVLTESLRGSAGNATFVRARGGVVVRARVVPADPRTPAQEASRERMARASRAWRGLTLAQAERWRDYAASLAVRQPGSGELLTPRPQNLFCQYAVKVLQMDPGALIPLDPPQGRFFGDAVQVSATPGPGALVFEASEPNQPGVATELLAQPLESPHRRPYLEKYRTQAFVAFSEGALEAQVPVAPGVYACAYRFVEVATGRATALAEIGIVQVA